MRKPQKANWYRIYVHKSKWCNAINNYLSFTVSTIGSSVGLLMSEWPNKSCSLIWASEHIPSYAHLCYVAHLLAHCCAHVHLLIFVAHQTLAQIFSLALFSSVVSFWSDRFFFNFLNAALLSILVNTSPLWYSFSPWGVSQNYIFCGPWAKTNQLP